MDKATLMNEQTKADAYFEGQKYTTDGEAYLQYSFSTENVNKNDILMEAFYLGDNGLCNAYRIYFKSQTSLETVVKHYKDEPDFEKVPNQFAWYNSKNGCIIHIIVQDDGGYEMVCETKSAK